MLRECASLQCQVDRRLLLRGALAAALPAIARPASAAAAKPLVVGGLAVTCNLTLPVACVARAAASRTDKSGAPQLAFEFSRYNGWPEAVEATLLAPADWTYCIGDDGVGSALVSFIVSNARAPLCRCYVLDDASVRPCRPVKLRTRREPSNAGKFTHPHEIEPILHTGDLN